MTALLLTAIFIAIFAIAALALVMAAYASVNKVGGIWFWRLGPIGGSFYRTSKPDYWAEEAMDREDHNHAV